MAAKNTGFDDKVVETSIIEPLISMFSGEVILAQANVMRYNNMSNRSCGAVGTLYFTNFKVAFVCSNSAGTPELKPSVASLENLLSEERNNIDDFVPLSVIHQVYAVSTIKQKRKKVKHSKKKEISTHYDVIEFETKDFRIIQYDFKFAKLHERRSCFQAISHHLFPTTITNLFAFDYGRHAPSTNIDGGRAFSSFRSRKDYEMNLSRLRSSEAWRVSAINTSFALCQSLPELVIVPAELDDQTLGNVASKYKDNRLPVWLWSDPATGVSLLVSAELKEKNGSFTHPIKLLESISSCQNKGSSYTTAIDVTQTCPNLWEVKRCFNKLRKACVVHSLKEYWSSDSYWLSNVESSGWLKLLSTCLELSIKITKIMKERATSVIVHDRDGRDFSILISSLVQILFDPYYRTQFGLQALIQKDWVMKGFPFLKRLGSLKHLGKKDGDGDNYDSESPLFVLFLDCLHQLLRQFPMKFEYTEQYLILLIDCSYSSLFKTFLFDSVLEWSHCVNAEKLLTAWDFITENIPQSKFTSVLTNPSYKVDESELHLYDGQIDQQSLSSANSICDSQTGIDVICPSTKLTDLRVWNSFYFRWYPCTDLNKGVSTEVMLQLQQKQFAEEVKYLQDRFMQLQHLSSLQGIYHHTRSASNLSTGSNSSIGRKKTKHKRNPSKFSHNEEAKDDYLSLMSGFYFLKMM